MDADARGSNVGRPVALAWALSGIVVLASAAQVGGARSGLEAIGSLPSLFGPSVASGTGTTLLLAVGVVVVLGWIGQGVALFSLRKDGHGAVLGLATGAVILLVGGWSFVSATAGGSLLSVLESLGTATVALVGTAGVGAVVVGSGDGSRQSDGDRPGTEAAAENESVVDDAVVERVEDALPEVVDRARSRSGAGGSDGTSAVTESALRKEIVSAIDRGDLTPTVSSRYGEGYEIVNLPTRFREVELPPDGDPVHLRTVREAIRERVAEERRPLPEVATMIETVTRQYDEMERYVRRREESFDDTLEEIEATIDDVETDCERLDGTFGKRTREYVLEGRHETVDGVPQVRAGIEDARDRLHACAFDEAERTIDEVEDQAEALLTAVDFFGGLAGMAEADGRGASVPNATARALLEDLSPALEASVDRPVTVTEERVRFGPARSTADDSSESERGGDGQATTNRRDGDATDAVSRDVERRNPAEISDEILYVLRELAGAVDDTELRVQYQTEQLPDGVGDPAVLVELAAFCRRQTDVVDSVDLQPGAPPGFLEVTFANGPPSQAITTLRERFADQHGGGR
ncbi:MAG: hypothetical protein ABEJ76_03565 [Halanaeroarchaeum sp.]